MKKIILLLGLQMSFTMLIAQYSLQPMLPTKGMIQKSNLWNVLIINNSQNTITGRLELILRNRTNGIEQITATTNQVTVEKGAKQLNNSLLSPIQYNFLNDAFIKQNQDLIPIGNYTACYRFTNMLGKNETLIEECVQFDIEPLSPPMLVTPGENAELAIQPSQFSWSPPTPLGLFNQLKYDVIIVEILPEQKPEEAIQQNLPIYTENNTPNNFINYKGSKLNFKKDKTYAWQVIAKDNNEYAAKSEVWVFKVKEDKQNVIEKNDTYTLIDENTKGTVVATLSELKFKYYSTNKEYKTLIQIKDKNNSVVFSTKQIIKYGDNYLKISLSGKLDKNQTYSLMFNTSDNKTILTSLKLL